MAATAARPKSILSVQNVSLRYGSRTIVHDVCLEIARGEVYGLLGPNGAGKSTLIRSICGRMPIPEGHIWLLDKRMKPCSGPSRHVGRVAQRAALFDHLTVWENLHTFGHLFGLSGRLLDSRIDEVLTRLSLTSTGRTASVRLSGGQRQRLHIAVALLTKPDLLILDEPTVGVDLASRHQLYDVLQGLTDSGMAVLLTTHDLPEARLLSDRIGILVDGRLVAEGTPDALIDDRFGATRKARVCARPEIHDKQSAFLDRLGLERSGEAEWTGLLDEARDLPALFAGIQRCPHLFTELILTRPDLQDVFAYWQDGGRALGAEDEGVAAPNGTGHRQGRRFETAREDGYTAVAMPGAADATWLPPTWNGQDTQGMTPQEWAE